MVWYYWNVHKDTVYIRTYFLFIQFFNIMHCEVACSWNKHNPEQTEQVFPKQPCDLPLKRCFEASVDCKSGYQGRRMCKYFAVVYQVLVVALKVHAKMSWEVPGDLCSTVRHLALDWHRWCRSTRYRKRDALNSCSVAWRAQLDHVEVKHGSKIMRKEYGDCSCLLQVSAGGNHGFPSGWCLPSRCSTACGCQRDSRLQKLRVNDAYDVIFVSFVSFTHFLSAKDTASDLWHSPVASMAVLLN